METTTIMTIQITWIDKEGAYLPIREVNNEMLEEAIKRTIVADDVKITSRKVFEYESR